jgi:hypothetical protein
MEPSQHEPSPDFRIQLTIIIDLAGNTSAIRSNWPNEQRQAICCTLDSPFSFYGGIHVMATSSKKRPQPSSTQAEQERGERLDTGRNIARGGKTTGEVPGVTAQPSPVTDVVMPPAPPGESPPHEVQKTRAVADALIELGENADPEKVKAAVHLKTGLDLSREEVTTIHAALRDRARRPPDLDQPPPQNSRRKSKH